MLSCPKCGSNDVTLVAGGCGLSPKIAFYCRTCKHSFTGWENGLNGKSKSIKK